MMRSVGGTPLVCFERTAASPAELGILHVGGAAMRTKIFGRCVLRGCRTVIRLARPLLRCAVCGFEMTMSVLLPARTMVRSAAYGAGHNIVGFRKAFAAYGAGLPFIKEHNNGILSVIHKLQQVYYTAFFAKFQQKKHKFKEILKIRRLTVALLCYKQYNTKCMNISF